MTTIASRPLSLEVLAELLDELRLAYQKKIPEKDMPGTVSVWFKSLGGMPEDAVRWAFTRAPLVCQNFPRISEVYADVVKYRQANHAVTQIVWRAEDLDVCRICGAQYGLHEVDRLKYNEDGNVVLDERNQPVRERVISSRQDIYHDRKAHGLDGRGSADPRDWQTPLTVVK